MSPQETPKTPAEVVNLGHKFDLFQDLWSPRIVAELNGQHVKLAKVKGTFVWHAHPDADELFLVVKGQLEIELRDRTVSLAEGELFVVPRGVEHRPVAREEAHILLLEPAGTLNTGDADSDRSVPDPLRL
ncbi:MAG: cupin domain-containing protein [Rhodothermales bacterium]|nr:cupin domain-containing protein [Rhodothermales bacterium]